MHDKDQAEMSKQHEMARCAELDQAARMASMAKPITALERAARAMAKLSGWDAWDTATTVAHTPSGTDPEEEREYWREMAKVAFNEFSQ
jgi:hypothetical protein